MFTCRQLQMAAVGPTSNLHVIVMGAVPVRPVSPTHRSIEIHRSTTDCKKQNTRSVATPTGSRNKNRSSVVHIATHVAAHIAAHFSAHGRVHFSFHIAATGIIQTNVDPFSLN